MTRAMLNLPAPPVFRRRAHTSLKLKKVDKINKAPFLMVPRFFDIYHPTTAWLINTIVGENDKELDRVLMDKTASGLLRFEPDPNAIQAQHTVMKDNKDFIITKAKYFQILDRPEMFDSKNTGGSLFGRHTIMYLTPLGLAIYLGKGKVAKQLLECINRDTNKKHVLARQPQFITCASDRHGDLMCIYDHNLAMLAESFDILQSMLVNNNWFPMEPFRILYRKQFIETSMRFDDWLDYAFYIMFTKRSSFNLARLSLSMLKRPSEHFKINYMCQPTRALKFTMVRDAEKVINNCKSYPRRLLRAAFYADKELKSTVNLIKAAEAFIKEGFFKLGGDPALPFDPKEDRRRCKRLEALPPYKPRSRELDVVWPSALYEFDCDCCISLLCGLLSRCHRLSKLAPFRAALKLATKALSDSGWLNYFSNISDQEFRDYFMGVDDAEKLRFAPEIFSYVRECVRITVFENRYDLAEFFSDTRLRQDIKDANDLNNDAKLLRLVQCRDDVVTGYVNLGKGEKLKPAGTVISSTSRSRGVGRDDPANKYYIDRRDIPPESFKTIMTNTANAERQFRSDESSTGVANGKDDISSDQHNTSTLQLNTDSRLIQKSTSKTNWIEATLELKAPSKLTIQGRKSI